MKKEESTSIIIYLIMVAAAILYSLTVLRTYSSLYFEGSTLLYVVYVLSAFIVGIIINSIIYEIAHYVGAKKGGYKVLSLNILGVCTVYGDKKVTKFASFDGLTGETRIAPVERKNNKPCNPSPYLLFPTLFIGIETIIIFILFNIFKNSTSNVLIGIGYYLLTTLLSGLLILFYNILPLKLDSTTDGYRLTMISNETNKEAFNELLRVDNEIANSKKVEIKTFEKITNFTAELNLNKIYQLLDEDKTEEAANLLVNICNAKNNISETLYINARAQLLYIRIIKEKDLKVLKEFYDKEVPMAERKKISENISMECIRTYILMAGLLDKSRSECLYVLKNINIAFKKVPESRAKVEIKLFNAAINKVNEAHPDWEIQKYLIQQKQ